MMGWTTDEGLLKAKPFASIDAGKCVPSDAFRFLDVAIDSMVKFLL
jgi:hypothetical protein